MYHQKNGAKVRVFSEMANEIIVFFLPSVKIIEYFPPFGNKAVTLQAEKIQEYKEIRRRITGERI